MAQGQLSPPLQGIDGDAVVVQASPRRAGCVWVDARRTYLTAADARRMAEELLAAADQAEEAEKAC